MKRGVLLLFFVALIGVIVWRYYQPVGDSSSGQRVDATVAKTEEGKLTPENIKEELKKTGRVVRSKARVVGEHIDDARIIAVIKGKYVMDKNLSVLAISVACRDGQVTLTGSATSAELIGRAVDLALQTSGVQNVESLLVVKN
jgi:osmotically-inducible protein OsmY